MAAGVAQPRHADAVPHPELFHLSAPGRHRADDFVAEDQGQLGFGQLAVHDVQVGAADAAGPHPDEHLLRAGMRDRDLQVFEGLARGLQDHGVHLLGNLHFFSLHYAAQDLFLPRLRPTFEGRFENRPYTPQLNKPGSRGRVCRGRAGRRWLR